MLPGVGANSIAPSVSRPDNDPIRVLDDIVSQVPGMVWSLTSDPAEPHAGLELGEFCAAGRRIGITVSP